MKEMILEARVMRRLSVRESSSGVRIEYTTSNPMNMQLPDTPVIIQLTTPQAIEFMAALGELINQGSER